MSLLCVTAGSKQGQAMCFDSAVNRKSFVQNFSLTVLSVAYNKWASPK